LKVNVNQTISSPLFNEPMRVVTITPGGSEVYVLGLVGTKSQTFRQVNLTVSQIEDLEIIDSAYTYAGNANLLRLGLQAYMLGIAYEFDPYFGLSISRVDPLPHQLEAVYDYFLKLARIRFLLADDAGAGKTIMAGLLIKELKLRGLADRILIVCPSNLSFQWQRELLEKFDEKFTVLKGSNIRNQFGSNQWLEHNRIITSLDLAKREDILPGLKQSHWDLVIVDEAHRMSCSTGGKTARYQLGEYLRDITDHFVLLTATPHKGDPENFTYFLQLLDKDVFADVKSIRHAMENQRAPFYLRRTKEAMVYFPERDNAGNWLQAKIFTKRITQTIAFQIEGAEFELYRNITNYVKRQSALAAADGSNPRAKAIGFLMSMYQRRLASSTFAMRKSLINRANRLEDALKDAYKLANEAPPSIPDEEEWEEMEEYEREKLEQILEAMSLVQNKELVKAEIADLRAFAKEAEAVEQANQEAKLAKLRFLLQQEGFFEHRDRRLLIFTEFKDTLYYLEEKLKSWGFAVGCIHGSMKPGSRNEPGTRLHSEQMFREGQIQILLATEAAGEGINLQVCNIMFNYDIPWNPNRLEQRMGRIHRYGQKKDCLIFNFVAENTIEGMVLKKLLEKLQNIRDALDDDAVFNVVGEVMPSDQIERILRDYYAGKLGDADLELRILQNVDEDRFRAICQNALEGLASKKLNLSMLIERRALAQERRVVPETIHRFINETAKIASFTIKDHPSLAHSFDLGKTPAHLKSYESERDWKLPALANQYPRCTTDRTTSEKHNLEWVTPGHPLFEALRRFTESKARKELGSGAAYYSLQHSEPVRLDFYRARIVDGLGIVIHERLFVVEIAEYKEPILREPTIIGDFIAAESEIELPAVAFSEEALNWLNDNAFMPFLNEIKAEREDEIKRVEKHVELSLTEIIGKADQEIGKLEDEIKLGVAGAEGRLAIAENHQANMIARREKRRKELQQQKSLTLQGVERITSIVVLPHPEAQSDSLKNLKPNYETEAIAMKVVMEYEESSGRKVFDVHEKNLGYDITSLDVSSGELRLIEVKGIGAESGTIILTPNERRVAEDRPDCFWLYVVTNCNTAPQLQAPILNPAQYQWNEVKKVQHYTISTAKIVEGNRNGTRI